MDNMRQPNVMLRPRAKTTRSAASHAHATAKAPNPGGTNHYLQMLNQVMSKAIAQLQAPSSAQSLNPADYQKYELDPAAYSKATADLTYGADIHDLEQALAQAPADTAHHISNIADWANQVLGTQQSGAAADHAQAGAQQAGMQQAGAGFAQALGGSANGASGGVSANGAIGAGGIGAIGAAGDSFNSDMGTILKQWGAEQKVNEQTRGEQLIRDIQNKLYDSKLSSGALQSKTLGDANEQRLQDELAMQNTAYNQKSDNSKTQLANLLQAAGLAQSGALLPGQIKGQQLSNAAQGLANQASKAGLGYTATAAGDAHANSVQQRKLNQIISDYNVATQGLRTKLLKGQISQQTYQTQMMKAQIKQFQQKYATGVNGGNDPYKIESLKPPDRYAMGQALSGNFLTKQGFLTISPGQLLNGLRNALYGSGYKKTGASEQYLIALAKTLMNGRRLAQYDATHHTAYSKGIGLPPELGGKPAPKPVKVPPGMHGPVHA